MKTITLKEEPIRKAPKKDRKKEIIQFFKSKPNQYITMSVICRDLKYAVSGSVVHHLLTLCDEGFLKNVKCPCGHGVLYYYGKPPKIE